ncbi:hypothetical protein A3709_20430 [Halioglobus sp. HI00S01]|uniref:hypothetical protein n=1 Tax=Halioglobus sp. HI00S01 TaxID=1822214 RepID=UPI0007C2B845|nr:hypothetical protein [Halioglobus sp. HI00S01]KZX57980.1 hypothetical protein A3709_20430 [Halioglobus sp. HI00S01]
MSPDFTTEQASQALRRKIADIRAAKGASGATPDWIFAAKAGADDQDLLSLFAHGGTEREMKAAFANPNMPDETILELIDIDANDPVAAARRSLAANEASNRGLIHGVLPTPTPSQTQNPGEAIDRNDGLTAEVSAIGEQPQLSSTMRDYALPKGFKDNLLVYEAKVEMIEQQAAPESRLVNEASKPKMNQGFPAADQSM